MNGKIHGWRFATIYFLLMLGCFLAFSAVSRPLRHQMTSLHSLFWTFAVPWSATCFAVLALAVWFVRYRQNVNTRKLSK